jgi:transposase
VGAPGAADSAGEARRSPARHRHARGDESILYILRTGCPWRYLPRGGFPPRSTVYNIFRNFRRDGVWNAMWESLHMDLREDLGREASPTAAVIDSQSLKSAEKGAVTMAL